MTCPALFRRWPEHSSQPGLAFTCGISHPLGKQQEAKVCCWRSDPTARSHHVTDSQSSWIFCLKIFLFAKNTKMMFFPSLKTSMQASPAASPSLVWAQSHPCRMVITEVMPTSCIAQIQWSTLLCTSSSA